MNETTAQEAAPESAAAAEEPQRSGPLVVGVETSHAGNITSALTEDDSVAVGDAVMIAEEGRELLATIVRPPQPIEGTPPKNARRLLRRATDEDVAADRRRRERALECCEVCATRIRERSLPMKLVEAELSPDEKKVTFLFFAENRVDFRGLVKELAQVLRMRIEMRQIGARDEAKHIPCMGSCGQPTCCSRYLRQFQSISIAMAKHQGLTPNPTKLTGMCGKLKCCLAYEHAVYDEQRRGMPKLGAPVECPKGVGKVVGHNVLKRECTVRLYGGAGEARLPCDDCRKLTPEEREAALEAVRRRKEEEDSRSSGRRGSRGRSPRDKRREDRRGKRREKDHGKKQD